MPYVPGLMSIEPVGCTKDDEYVTVLAVQIAGYVGEIEKGPSSPATLVTMRINKNQPILAF